MATSLSGAFAQTSPTRPESIVVFAPHPDDEVIGCAGIMIQALARGARVTVVDITSGDGFDAAAAGVAFGEYTYGLKRFGELMVCTSSGVGTWGPLMRAGTRPEIVLIQLE